MRATRPRARLLCPERLRGIERPFGWVPLRLLTSGLLAQLSREAKLLYFFLCLVSDRQGLSFYGERRLERELGLARGALHRARQELKRYDLLAFDGRIYQLLSLPTGQLLQHLNLRKRSYRGEGLVPVSRALHNLFGGH